MSGRIFQCCSNLGTPEQPLYATRASPFQLTETLAPLFKWEGGDMTAGALPAGAILAAKGCDDEPVFFIAQANGTLQQVPELHVEVQRTLASVDARAIWNYLRPRE